MTLLKSASSAYELAEHVQPERFAVECIEADRFSRTIRRLLRGVGEDTENPLWESVFECAKAVRWRAGAEGVPFSDPSSTARLAFDSLEEAGTRVEGLIDISIARTLRTLITAARAYRQEDNAALSSAILSCLADGDPDRTCVVCVNGRSAAATQAWLERVGATAQVLKPSDYLAAPSWDLAVFLGPSDWFASRFFTCPQSNAITLVHHAHIRDATSARGIFGSFATAPLQVQIRGGNKALSYLITEDADQGAEEDLASGQIPEPSWNAMVKRAPHDDSGQDKVAARLIILAAGHGLWLPTDATTIRGLHLSAPAGERVVNLRASEISAGSVIIVRDGDTMSATIAAMADSALGPTAKHYRKLQYDWKTTLRAEVGRIGLRALGAKLRADGSQTSNLRYWMSEECIRPLNDSDFLILLNHLGIEKPGSYLAGGRSLWKAHLKAGQTLSDALEKVVEQADLSELTSSGYQRLHLNDAAIKTTLGAYRVLAVNPTVHEVGMGSTRRPFRIEGAQWLE